MNYGSDAAESQLTCALYYKDKAEEMETADVANDGWNSRQEFSKLSKSIDMIGMPFGDIFNQNRYLINNVNMKLRLLRHNPEFCLMAKAAAAAEGEQAQLQSYKIHIEQATLFVHKVKISPSSILSHAAIMQQNTPVKYPIRRVEMKTFSLSTGDMGANRDNIVLGQMPTRVVLGLVSGAAMNGNLTKNPFNFQNFNLNYLSLFIDSEQIPATPLTPDFTSNQYIREYQTLFDALDIWRGDRGIQISRKDYPNGYTLYAFDLTPTQSASGNSACFNLLRQGNLRLMMKFAAPLAETINVIMHLTYENMLEVDSMRNVVYDFST